MTTCTANSTGHTLAEIRDLNGNPIHARQPLPTLRRTASGHLFLPKAFPVPSLRPASNSCQEIHAIDTVRALVPPNRLFPSRGDECIVIGQIPAQKVKDSIVEPPPKLNVCARRKRVGGGERDVLRRQGRMMVEDKGERRRSCVGDVDRVCEVEDHGVEVREADVRDGVDDEDEFEVGDHGVEVREVDDGDEVNAVLTHSLSRVSSQDAQQGSVRSGTLLLPEAGWWSAAALTRLGLLRSDMEWDGEVKHLRVELRGD